MHSGAIENLLFCNFKDIWTFKRHDGTSIYVNKHETVKWLTEYEAKSGCCRLFASSLERSKLELIMDVMKYSLGVPLPDDRLDKDFDKFSLLWPKENLVKRIEKE